MTKALGVTSSLGITGLRILDKVKLLTTNTTIVFMPLSNLLNQEEQNSQSFNPFTAPYTQASATSRSHSINSNSSFENPFLSSQPTNNYNTTTTNTHGTVNNNINVNPYPTSFRDYARKRKRTEDNDPDASCYVRSRSVNSRLTGTVGSSREVRH